MATSKRTIEPDVLAVLERSTITPTGVKLPEQLERKLYEKVDKVLKMAGGKWNRSAGQHVFGKDPREVLGLALESGIIVDKKVENQQFFTPPAVANMMMNRLREKGSLANMTVLEPSCGSGNLLGALIAAGVDPRLINAVEIDPELARATKQAYPEVHILDADFMTLGAVRSQDLVAMNPPFTNRQDIDHVTRALEHLKPGGRLVAIMSPHFTFAENKKSEAFRELLEEHEHTVTELPEGSFSSSGTGINTVMVTIDLPR